MRSIIVDLDGVITKYDFPALTKKWFGATIHNKGVWCYSIEDSLGVATEDVVKMFQEEVEAPPNLVPGAINTLKLFMARDYEVYVLTNRLYFTDENRLIAWLDKYGIPYSAVLTNGDLPDYVVAHIDDSPTKLMSTRSKTEVKHSILFDNPWNRQCLNITGQLERAKNWGQVKEIIDVKR